MDKFTKPELLNFLCEGPEQDYDDIIDSPTVDGPTEDGIL